MQATEAQGVFTNYVDKILAFFNHLPTCAYILYLINLDKRWNFWTNYPPLLVNVVCECPLTVLILYILLKYISILPTIHDFLLASIKSETLLKQVNYYYNFWAIFQIIVINNAGYIQKCHHSNVIIAALTLTKCTKNNFKKW